MSLILLNIATAFIVSLIFGFALLKTYGLFLRGVKENNQLKIWWSFSCGIFLLTMVVFLFGR